MGFDLFLSIYHPLPVHLCVERSLLYLTVRMSVVVCHCWFDLTPISKPLRNQQLLWFLLDYSSIKRCWIQIPGKSLKIDMKSKLILITLLYFILTKLMSPIPLIFQPPLKPTGHFSQPNQFPMGRIMPRSIFFLSYILY